MKTSYFFKHIAGTLLFLFILFISAGRIDYWYGWIYVFISLVMFILNYTVLRIDPELLKERSKPQQDVKKWDKKILGISFLLTIIMYVTAGLDSGRYQWSPDFPVSLILSGILLTITGQLLFLIAQKQNKFFSSTVRIQADRNHTVYDKGLYKIVRHPAYLGSIIQSLGFPLLFGSLWSILPVSLLIIVFILRTHLEDRTLKTELKGYPEYSERIRYRIIPFVW